MTPPTPPSTASSTDILPIEQLDITDPQGLADWHERFDQYCDPAKKISHYPMLIGTQACRHKDLAYPTTISTCNVDDLKQLLEDHLAKVRGLRTVEPQNLP